MDITIVLLLIGILVFLLFEVSHNEKYNEESSRFEKFMEDPTYSPDNDLYEHMDT